MFFVPLLFSGHMTTKLYFEYSSGQCRGLLLKKVCSLDSSGCSLTARAFNYQGRAEQGTMMVNKLHEIQALLCQFVIFSTHLQPGDIR